MTEAVEEERDEKRALELLWRTLCSPDGRSAICAKCGGSQRFHRVKGRRAYACDRCGAHVYPAAETLFAGSPAPLSTWLSAVCMMIERPNASMPREMAETLGLGYKTAWRMRKKIEQVLRADGEDAALLRELAQGWIGGTLRSDSEMPLETPQDRIRAAACRVMAERGLASTRISDIAREAGVSSATVHYYFRSKDDVLLAAFRWAGEQLHEGVRRMREERVDPVDDIQRLLHMSTASDQALHDEYILWLEVWARVRSHPRFLDECVKSSRQWYDVVLEMVERGVDEGVFVPAAPVHEICEWYVAMSESLAFRTALGYADMPAERARRILASFTARQLGLAFDDLDG